MEVFFWPLCGNYRSICKKPPAAKMPLADHRNEKAEVIIPLESHANVKDIVRVITKATFKRGTTLVGLSQIKILMSWKVEEVPHMKGI